MPLHSWEVLDIVSKAYRHAYDAYVLLLAAIMCTKPYIHACVSFLEVYDAIKERRNGGGR